MENCAVNNNINNDFLSQSYSEGIERITGTKDHLVSFQVPKELLMVREQTWDNFFDKYSEEVSDDIELNVHTMEPEEKEEKEESEEEYRGHRIPMRKPASLIQYWVNTGNPPYKVLLDNKSSTGSSLSEKEITSPSYSLPSNNINRNNKLKDKTNSSCSSVDTAAYILSNANITKKADTIAIIEGAKYNDIKFLKDICVNDTETETCNDKIKKIEIVSANHTITGDNNNDHINILDISSSKTEKNMDNVAETNDQLNINESASTETVICISIQNPPCYETDKIDILSQKSLPSIKDIASIFRQFDKTSKQISDKNNSPLDQNNALEKSSIENQTLMAVIKNKTIKKDINPSLSTVSSFHRKKLYTGRDSPVDLISTERCSRNRLSETNLNLHPALDTGSMIKRISSTNKNEKKHLSSCSRKNSDSKKTQKKESKYFTVPNEDITDANEQEITNNNRIQDSIIDELDNNLLHPCNNLDAQGTDILFSKHNDTNTSIKTKAGEKDLVLFNLNPIVLLERLTPSFNRHKFESVNDKDTAPESNIYSNNSGKIYSRQIENLELETVDSESTILICKCQKNTLCPSSSTESSLQLRLSVEDDFSVLSREKNTEKENKQLKRNTDMNQDKILRVILERLPQSVVKNYANITVKSQVLGKNASPSSRTHQEQISNEHETYTSCKTSKKYNMKFPKVVLEQLPNIYSNKSNDARNINIIADKNQILQINNKKEKSKSTIQIPVYKNVETYAQTNHNIGNYSLRMKIRLKQNDNEESDMFDTVAKNRNQILNKVNSDSTFLHINNDSQSKYSKYSVLTISSDEDDLVQLIQPSKKKLRMSIDEKTDETSFAHKHLYNETKLSSTSKSKYHYDKDLCAKITSVKIDGSIKEKKKERRTKKIEAKSFNNNNMTLDASLPSHKRVSFFQNVIDKSDSNRTVESLYKQKKMCPLLNRDNRNNKEYSGKAIKENEINHKDDNCVVLFQTKISDTDFSDSALSDSASITFTRTSLRNSSRYRLRDHNCTNKKRFFNDSIVKKYYKERPSLLNSSIEKYDVANRKYNTRNKLRSTSNKETKISKINEQFAHTEFNDDIDLNDNNTTKNILHSSVTSKINTLLQKENKTLLNTSFGKDDLRISPKNKLVSGISNSKNSLTIQQNDEIAKTKLLMFQTKSYYDSDSESL